MALSRKSFKDTQALFKAKSSAASSDAHANDVENGKTQSTAPSSTLKSHNKDSRAYDHERQRLKKAADFVKMRARKAQYGAGSAGKGHHRTASGKDFVDGAQLSEKGGRLQEEDLEYDELGEGLVLSNSRKENMGIVTIVADQPRYEVKLADLIRPSKPRKLKAKGDGDFEVIPHIRSVIALDDNTPDELSVDEPWEHIYNTDCEENRGLSYAQVAALSK